MHGALSLLGIEGVVERLDATLLVVGDMAIVKIAIIEGTVENPFEVMKNLSHLARAVGARTLRVEAVLATKG